jgi:hypothetical protein
MASEKIKQFNEILSSFLIQVSPLVGSTYNQQFETIVKYNSLLPIEQFLVHALPVREKILSRDESYFNNNSNHLEKIGDNSYILNEILRLQNIYSHLDDTSRSNVWDIFQAMLILGEEYVSIKYANANANKDIR